MCAKNFENPTMLSKVTAKNVGDVFFWDTLYTVAHVFVSSSGSGLFSDFVIYITYISLIEMFICLVI